MTLGSSGIAPRSDKPSSSSSRRKPGPSPLARQFRHTDRAKRNSYASTSSIFQSRFHFLSCFSRVIADSALSWTSNHTSLCRPYLPVKPSTSFPDAGRHAAEDSTSRQRTSFLSACWSVCRRKTVCSRKWIPAFAGMTIVWDAAPAFAGMTIVWDVAPAFAGMTTTSTVFTGDVNSISSLPRRLSRRPRPCCWR